MAGQPTAMHVARIRSGYTGKDGRRREYESAYLRRTYRDGGTVRHETLANLSGLGEHTIGLIKAALKGAPLVPAGQAMTIIRSLPHGHVAAAHAMAARLGLPKLLGPAGPQRDLALALVISRVVAPGSKLATLAWWDDVTLGADLGVAGASTDQVYAAMDWLEARQDAIEARLARRHLAPAANPARMALLDLSSSWLEGSCCPLGARGYSRDGKKVQGADRVRAAYRPGGPPGRGPGAAQQRRRPGRVHPAHRDGTDQVPSGQDGDGRGPRDDHLRPHRGAVRAG
jgi:hypothetical protein